ncbi:MAG: anhydro-N-acetylmuramic acid kinase, partial [Gammaproteobacteria bacterium]
FEGGRLAETRYRCTPYPPELRRTLDFAVAPNPSITLDALGEAHVRIGHAFADAVIGFLADLGLSARDITAIGSHGQTVFHRPGGQYGFTMQIGDPNVIAWRTGIPTVADFRGMDVAAGGQGAPLVPAFHADLWQVAAQQRAVVNIGGIANVTMLPPRGTAAVTGFDTGPGNCLLDEWIALHRQHRFDAQGGWAASGRPVPALLAALLEDPYFHRPSPKSTGRDYFNLAWLQSRLHDLPGSEPAAADIQATLLELTAASIAMAVKQDAEVSELLVCGGGAHNPPLMAALSRRLSGTRVASTHTSGVDPDAVEAVAFAWLARRRLSREPGNLPAVTGAAAPAILGAVYRPRPV